MSESFFGGWFYVQDKWTSIAHGEPPKIKANDFDVGQWSPDQFIEYPEDPCQQDPETGPARANILIFHLLELSLKLKGIFIFLIIKYYKIKETFNF